MLNIEYKTATIVELTRTVVGSEKRELGIVVGYHKDYGNNLRLSASNENTEWFCFLGYNYDLYREIKKQMAQEEVETTNAYCVATEDASKVVKPYIFQFDEEIIDFNGLVYTISKLEYEGSEGIKTNHKRRAEILGGNHRGYIFYLKLVRAQGMGRTVKIGIEELGKYYRVL